VIIFGLPEHFVTTALVPHMGVVLLSLYVMFVVERFLGKKQSSAIGSPVPHRNPVA
jgi:hypothetical protein